MRTSDARRPHAVAIALLALLAQIVLPHLHRWQTAGHVAPESATVARAADPSPGLVQATGGAASEHAETACPVCQAIAGAHDFLRAGLDLPAPPPARAIAAGGLASRLAHAAGSEHGARSPPRA